MKSFTIFPMSNYKSKPIGLAITIVSLILLLIVSIHGALPFPSQANAEQQFDLFFAVATFGLYVIAWTKEKNEDERVQKIRAKAMQIAFGMFVIITLCPALVSIVADIQKHTSAINYSLSNVELIGICAFILAIYLVVFYIGLLFDPAWIYADDTVMVNMRKNKKFFIVYVLALIVLFLLIFIFHKK